MAYFRKFFRPWKKRIQFCGRDFPIHLVNLRQFCEDMAEVIIRIQVIRFRGFCNAVDHCTGTGTFDRVDKQPVPPSGREWPDTPFTGGIIDWNLPVFQKYPQVFLLIDTVIQSLCCFSLGEDGCIRQTFFLIRSGIFAVSCQTMASDLLYLRAHFCSPAYKAVRSPDMRRCSDC